MKVEHLTILGNSVIRDTADIAPETIALLEPFQITEGELTLPFPHSSLSVSLVTSSTGALFNVLKDERTGIINLCCFDPVYRQEVLAAAKGILDTLQIPAEERRDPKMGVFLYSFGVDPFALTPGEVMLAGEVEFYIWYSLYLAWQKGGKG